MEDILAKIEGCIDNVIMDVDTEHISAVTIDDKYIVSISESSDVQACSCYSSCGSNFSQNGKCSCYTSCGSNFNKG